MLGPTMGGVLYGLAGIALPLLLFSILVLLSLPALYWSMVEETKHDGTDIDEIDSNENHDENEGLKASELVNVTTVNSTFVTLVAAVGFGFISPVAAPHFKDVLDPNMSAGQVGLASGHVRGRRRPSQAAGPQMGQTAYDGLRPCPVGGPT